MRPINARECDELAQREGITFEQAYRKMKVRQLAGERQYHPYDPRAYPWLNAENAKAAAEAAAKIAPGLDFHANQRRAA